MNASLEIRKLSPRYVRELVHILETDELWKRLMSIIPKRLEKTNYVCDISVENPHKYHFEHFKLIENASQKYRRDCTEILLDEWGTSGRVRPALGHLLYLLTKAKLFRAADFVGVELLNQERPKRPSSGPEALIPIDLPEMHISEDTRQEEIEELLDQIEYPFTATQTGRIPEENVTISDMIKFSIGTFSDRQNEREPGNRPEISQLLNDSEPNIPNFELINASLSVTSVSDSSGSNINPAFSILLSKVSSESNEGPLVLEENLLSEPNIVNFSEVNNSEQVELPNLSIFQSNQ